MSDEDVQIPECPGDGYFVVKSPKSGLHQIQVSDAHIYAIGTANGLKFGDLDIGIPWENYVRTEGGLEVQAKKG